MSLLSAKAFCNLVGAQAISRANTSILSACLAGLRHSFMSPSEKSKGVEHTNIIISTNNNRPKSAVLKKCFFHVCVQDVN